MWPFKKKTPVVEVDPNENMRLGNVLDKHLTKYIRVVNINNSVKTGMILFGLTLFMFNIFLSSFKEKETNHIASIALSGVMSSENDMGSAAQFAEHFTKAVNDETAKAIVIIANSGGGSPTQGESINTLISEYTKKPLTERKPVYLSVQEVCASACMMAFASTDKILVHYNSMIGSIAVRMDGWGLDKFLATFDIERKVIATGKYKDLFDPYKNLTEEEKEFIRTDVMGPMHKHFVQVVKDGRGDKLDLTNEMLFAGMIFSGDDGLKVGLADEVQTTLQLEDTLKKEFTVDEIRRYNKPSKFNLKSLFSTSVETAIRNIVSESFTVTM